MKKNNKISKNEINKKSSKNQYEKSM